MKNPQLRPAKFILPLIIIIVISAVIWAASYSYGRANINYAEDIAKPLESGLVQAGAVKKCSNGDAGRGPDNDRPWYQSYFQISKNEEQAVAAITRVAKENGYNLVHASPTNRGPLGVSNQFIDKWYFDNASKNSSYADPSSGSIRLTAQVNADGVDKVCHEAMTIDSSHSVIGVEVKLPPFKH